MADEKKDDTTVVPTDSDKPTRHKRDRKEVSDVVDRLVSRYGTERAALAVLADENLDYRESLKDLKSKVPADGTRTLSADEAKLFDAFAALGKSPKDLTAALSERDQFALENAEHRASTLAAEAAKAIGSDKPAVLARILKAEGYRLELKDEKDGDEVKKVAYAIKGEGDQAESTELAALLTTTLSDYKPALIADAQPQRTTGAPIPSQPPRGTAPAPKETTTEQLKEQKRATGAYFA